MKEGEATQIEHKPKRVYNRKPSLRMKKAAKILLENKGKSVSGALRKAGYPPTTAKNPQQVTKSQSWQALMDEYLPNDLIARKHKELLEAEHTNFFVIKGKIKEEVVPDHMARRAGIDMAHKLRGNYAPEKIELERRKFQDMSDEELRNTIAEAKKVLLKK